MCDYLKNYHIPQFKNPMEVRFWISKMSKNNKFLIEITNRKIKEDKNLEIMKEKKMVYDIRKDILDLELEEYFIPSTPNSCESIKSCVSFSSTKCVVNKFSLYSIQPDVYLRDRSNSYDSIDNLRDRSNSCDSIDNLRISPAMSPGVTTELSPAMSPGVTPGSVCDKKLSLVDYSSSSDDNWDKLNFKDYDEFIC